MAGAAECRATVDRRWTSHGALGVRCSRPAHGRDRRGTRSAEGARQADEEPSRYG